MSSFTSSDFYYSTQNDEVSIGNINRYGICCNAFINATNKISVIKIPSRVQSNGATYTITRVMENAFCQNNNIESVTISESIVKIGVAAFTQCKSLKEVIFEHNSQLQIIETNAFDQCPNLSEIIIPPFVNTINPYAFGHFFRLSKVVYCGKTTFSQSTIITADSNADPSQLKIYVVEGLYQSSFFGSFPVTFTSLCPSSHVSTFHIRHSIRCIIFSLTKMIANV